MTPRNTAASNTPSTYGWVERSFHWSIAGLIVTAVVLGSLAHDAPFGTDAELARKALLFSAHKTVGIAVFFIALARIIWALTQPRPAPLHPDRRLETFLAAAVHWLLYGALVLVPLTGWIHHAASTGFAPIWWPLGQSLPFVPKDAALSATFGSLHLVFKQVLIGALILHVVGTIKHVVLDKDATLGRMWKGTDPGPLAAARTHVAPIAVSGVVWAAALGAALLLPSEGGEASAVPSAEVSGVSTWTVEEGTLSITVTQMGAEVTGSFADWQAAIDFDETPRADGSLGTVEVGVATGSLTLGSVTTQATGPEFLAAASFPQADFTAIILPDGDAYVADGTLTIRDVAVPLRLPFTLDLSGDRAVMAGSAPLDRRDFGMGESYPDESSVGFGVTVDVDLTAVRAD